MKAEDVITVSDEEMVEGVRLVAEEMKMVTELPGGASLMGAIAAKKKFPELNKIGIVLSGGNVDFEKFLGLFKTLSSK